MSIKEIGKEPEGCGKILNLDKCTVARFRKGLPTETPITCGMIVPRPDPFLDTTTYDPEYCEDCSPAYAEFLWARICAESDFFND